jgi:aspartate carbamoyltransferase regulatory subunit
MGKKAINPIKNGTVIDHIPAGKAKNVWEMLNLPSSEEKMFLGKNLRSKKLGKKDMLMFENLELSLKQLNVIALIASSATISIIKNGEITSKDQVTLPELVEKVITCPNPKCITNEEGVVTKFDVEENGDVEVRCCYCEKKYSINNVEIKM